MSTETDLSPDEKNKAVAAGKRAVIVNKEIQRSQQPHGLMRVVRRPSYQSFSPLGGPGAPQTLGARLPRSSSSQSVVLLMAASFIIFALAGPTAQASVSHKLTSLTKKGTTEAPPTTHWMTTQNAASWMILSLILVFMTDIPFTEQLAVAFTWLIFVSTLLTLGPNAFDTLTKLTTTAPKPQEVHRPAITTTAKVGATT